MKKKNLNLLKLNKNSISNLSSSKLIGRELNNSIHCIPSRQCDPTIKATDVDCYCTIDPRLICVGSIDQCDVRDTHVLSVCYCPA